MGTVSRASVVRTYERFAPAYDATFGSIVGRYHRHIGEFVRARGARRVLEVGIGTGLSLAHYPAGTCLTGVDICPRMLEKARRRQHQAAGCEVDLRLVDGEQLPFGDGSFDAVVLPFVISVTPDPERLMAEVERVLAPGGSVLILNHFAGVRGLKWLEGMFSPVADLIGFRSDLNIERVLTSTTMHASRTKALAPAGFFTLLELKRA